LPHQAVNIHHSPGHLRYGYLVGLMGRMFAILVYRPGAPKSEVFVTVTNGGTDATARAQVKSVVAPIPAATHTIAAIVR
jgi:hypothetical protein